MQKRERDWFIDILVPIYTGLIAAAVFIGIIKMFGC